MKTSVRHILVIVIYAVLTLVMTLPVALKLSSHVAGVGGDPWQTMWRFDSKAKLLSRPSEAFGVGGWFREEFLGGGQPRLANLSVWPWMPLHALFGEPVAYNLVWLLSFILSGYGMYVLVEYLTKQSLPGFLAGVAYMFLPFHVAHSLGHFGAMQLEWLPFIVLASLVWFKQPTVGKTVTLAALLTIQAWTEHHYMLWLGILLLITLIFWRKEIFARQDYGRQAKFKIQTLLLVALVFITVVVPYIPTIRLAAQPTSAINLGDEQLIRFSADIFSFGVPSPFHPLWGGFFNKNFAAFFTGNIAESTQYLGWFMLLFILFFHQPVSATQKKYWSIVALVFGVIALGPQLHVFGKLTGVPLPYGLIANWPGITAVRAVARAGAFVGLAVSVLFGLVLAKQLRRVVSSAAVLALVLLDFLFAPVPMQSAQLSPAYQLVQSLPGDALIELPAATHYTIASRALYASSFTHKDVLGNIALERALDSNQFKLAKEIPGIRQLLYLRTTELVEDRDEFFGQNLAETLWDAMMWLRIPAILVHRDSVSTFQLDAIDHFLHDQAKLERHDFNDVEVYTKPNDLIGDGVFLIRGDGWEHIGYDAKRGAVFAEVPDRATVTLVNGTGSQKTVDLMFDVAPESPATLAVVSSNAVLSLDHRLVIPPGETQVSFIRSGEGKAIIMNPHLTTAP